MSSRLENRKNLFRLFLVTFVLSSFLILMSFHYKQNGKINVTLIGDSYRTISLNLDYEDEGFTIKKGNKEIDSSKIEFNITDNINKNVVGKYEIDYEINYNDNIYKLKRYVEVIDDIAPVITIHQDYAEKYFCKKTNKLNLSYTAEDNYDGIITDNVKVKVGDDKVILTVQDSAGNQARKEVPLKIVNDEKAAIIELNGSDIIYLALGSEYQELGATLIDGCGKENEESLEISNNIDKNTVGDYEVIYKYVSESGTETKMMRKVVVYEPNNSSINLPNTKEKIVYLTFDDGPGQYTEKLLDILNKNDVKATFFVTNQFKKYVPLIKREYEEGHAIAVHSLTHKWSIYQSVETYLKDFNDMNDIIYRYTGQRTNLFRFPGGSSNTISRKYSTGVVKAIASKMTEYGYVYFDWNVDSNDAGGASSKEILNNVIDGMNRYNVSIVLMHDIKKNTIEVIEEIIEYGLDNNFRFETLNVNSPTIHHNIHN